MRKLVILMLGILLFGQAGIGQNVGIGTTNPTADLHVHEGTSTTVMQKLTTSEAQVIIGYDNSNQGVLGTVTNHDLRVRTNNINRFTIANTGNIGIGTTLPTQKLQLANGSIFISGLGATNEKGLLFGESNDPLYGWIYDGVGSSNDNKLHLREYLGTPSDILTIKGDGKIGFGTNDPAEKIDVSDGSILLSNLGASESKGYLLGESGSPTYGWIYDGVGSGAANTLILREFIGTESDLLAIDGNGDMKLSSLEGTNRRALYVEPDGTLSAGQEIHYYSGDNSGVNEDWDEDFRENIHLPEGAKLISIEFYYVDDADNAQFEFVVKRSVFAPTGSSSLISSSSGTSFSSSVGQIKLINFSAALPPVDNQSAALYVRVTRDESLLGVGSDLRFFNYRIKYILE